MLRVVTDGAADMPPEWEKEFDIQIIPINIQFGDKSYLQGVDINNVGFYKMVDDTHKIPKTAQPSPHQFVEFYKKIAQKGDEIISIHVTSKLSGTYTSAVQAAQEVGNLFNVFPVDSMSGSIGIGFMCREARRMARLGRTAVEIVKTLEELRESIRPIFTLDTLEYARLSGRVGALQAALASAMNVKPIAVMRGGVLNMVERVRTRKASIERVIEIGKEEFGQKAVYLGVLHANDKPSGEALLAAAIQHFNVQGEAVLADLSISVAANLGPGAVGLVLYPAE